MPELFCRPSAANRVKGFAPRGYAQDYHKAGEGGDLADPQPREAEPFTRQELMGHTKIETTKIYLHVMKQGGVGAVSPLDRIKDTRQEG